MIPFTLAMALGVKLIGATLTSGGLGVAGVVVVVDICFSLRWAGGGDVADLTPLRFGWT
jgi:hypothetical protein